jgi:hypothetical protein
MSPDRAEAPTDSDFGSTNIHNLQIRLYNSRRPLQLSLRSPPVNIRTPKVEYILLKKAFTNVIALGIAERTTNENAV